MATRPGAAKATSQAATGTGASSEVATPAKEAGDTASPEEQATVDTPSPAKISATGVDPAKQPIEEQPEEDTMVIWKGDPNVTERRMTDEDWKNAGVSDGHYVAWSAMNRNAVPVDQFSERELAVLRRSGDFKIPEKEIEE